MAHGSPKAPTGFRTATPAALSLVVVTAILAAVWIAGAVSAPVLAGSGSGAGEAIRTLYAPVCHQWAERTLHINGHPTAVCARCLGLYLGGLVGLVLGAVAGAWRRRTSPWVFCVMVAPTVADAVLAGLGLPSLSNLARALLAVPAGVAAGWFLAMALGDLAVQLTDRQRHPPLPVTDNDAPARGCVAATRSRTNGGGA